uniref:Uncharacterized protein n=1 Tax=Oryza brachyantha TaxID=4533 RepID=J3M9P8_ORYBR
MHGLGSPSTAGYSFLSDQTIILHHPPCMHRCLHCRASRCMMVCTCECVVYDRSSSISGDAAGQVRRGPPTWL